MHFDIHPSGMSWELTRSSSLQYSYPWVYLLHKAPRNAGRDEHCLQIWYLAGLFLAAPVSDNWTAFTEYYDESLLCNYLGS